MLDGVAGRGFAVRLDCKPNDNFHQRLGRYFQPRFGTVMNKNGSGAFGEWPRGGEITLISKQVSKAVKTCSCIGMIRAENLLPDC